LLILYGGPGFPLFPRIHDFGVRAGLEDAYTVAYWEQRGTGKSYHPEILSESMTIDQFVKDVIEVTDLLREQFEKERIGLLGASWGTVLGLRALDRSPDRFWGYVGTGQMVNVLEGDRRSYEFTLEEARRRGNETALEELESIGVPPYTFDEVMTQRKWLGRFGGIRHVGDPPGMVSMLTDLLTTSEYSWTDVWHLAANPFFSLEHLLDELYSVDLPTRISEVQRPIYFLQGRHDQLTPGSLVRSYYDQLRAPQKEWFWLDDSAHFPFLEQPERFGQILRTAAPQPSTPVG
jgi:pimeloyl-ACP methyl ester carboxylesterase